MIEKRLNELEHLLKVELKNYIAAIKRLDIVINSTIDKVTLSINEKQKKEAVESITDMMAIIDNVHRIIGTAFESAKENMLISNDKSIKLIDRIEEIVPKL